MISTRASAATCDPGFSIFCPFTNTFPANKTACARSREGTNPRSTIKTSNRIFPSLIFGLPLPEGTISEVVLDFMRKQNSGRTNCFLCVLRLSLCPLCHSSRLSLRPVLYVSDDATSIVILRSAPLPQAGRRISPAFSVFSDFLCVNVLAFLFDSIHQCLYQCSSAFISGEFNNRNSTDQPYARRATKNCANCRNLPPRSP